MNIDSILKLTVNSLKAAMPDAITVGQLKRSVKEYDAATLKTVEISSSTLNVEIIMDSITDEEIQASSILKTDLKLYVIGDKINEISYYDSVIVEGKSYKIFKLVDQVVGSKSAVWTIIARK